MKLNLIDKAVAFVSPAAGFARAQKRMAIELQARAYDGAAKGRRTVDWRSTGSSANMEIHKGITWLRGRARELVRNNPYVNNAIQRTLPNNVVGTGILLNPNYTSSTGAETAATKKVNVTIKKQWKLWADSTNCDYDGNLNFYGIQHLCVTSLAESGEVLIRKIWNSDLTFPLQLQVLEADFIDTTKHDTLQTPGDNRKYYGIEYNSKNKRVAYWLYKQHPAEFGALESVRVPAEEIIHIFCVSRPGQLRGVPFPAPSMLRVKDLGDYEDAELVRQKIAACFSVFVTNDGENDPTALTQRDARLEKVEPGIIEHLGHGETVTFASPPTTQGYDPYTRNVLRGIAVGIGVTYETLTGDLSNVNFSSGRMGWIEANRQVEQLQWNVIIPKLQAVFNWFVQMGEIKGFVAEGMQIPVTWTPPARQMIDPLKEGKADDMAVRSGFKSWQQLVRERGYNPEDVAREMDEDAKMFDRLKLKPTCDQRYDPAGIKAETDLAEFEAPEETTNTKPKKD